MAGGLEGTVIFQFPADIFPECHVQLQILATYSHFTILKQFFVFDKIAFLLQQ